MSDELRLFTCDRHAGHLRLTETACADMWRQARRAEPGDRLFPCRGCEVGAKHAGCEPDEAQDRLPAEAMCARCHRPAHRVIFGRICVSCYNRGLEWQKGRNAKGTRPVTVPPLRDATVAYIDDAGRHEIHLKGVASTLESVLSVARRRQQRTRFTRSASVIERVG